MISENVTVKQKLFQKGRFIRIKNWPSEEQTVKNNGLFRRYPKIAMAKRGTYERKSDDLTKKTATQAPNFSYIYHSYM